MENKRDLLLQYAENPQSVSEEVEALDQSDRESLAIFIAMYNKFAEQRYRTNAGKSEAERLLKQNIDTSSLESSISKDEIFSDLNPSELKQLENKALYENALESLNKLGHQIDTFPKTKIDSKFTQKISDTFDFVEKTLTTSDSLATEADLLKLKKIKIKISELIIRHTNKNNFKELSPSLIQYDTVFEADEVPDENKKEFANSLVKSLKAHRDNPKNTTFQNAMLDNLIETYSKKL